MQSYCQCVNEYAYFTQNIKVKVNEPYPLLKWSEPPGDQIQNLAGDNAGQHGQGSQIAVIPPISETLYVPEKLQI